MRAWLLACATIVAIGCGKHTGSNGDIDAPGTGSGVDAAWDAPPFTGNCMSSNPQCSNCIDDDHDGLIDGYDPECTGPFDNDEATFATGIPGDNKDPVEQDCFFDGDSGAGNDGCNVHVCCLLGAKTVAECPIGQNKYNPADCPPPIGTKPLSQMCIDVCGKLTPPGCDCFGCCKVCDPTGTMCNTVIINPAVSPDCTPQTLNDPTKCLPCTQETSCGTTDCGGTSCTLCPGQTQLPPGCTGQMCPSGEQSCTNMACPNGTYCSNGCCIGVIQ